MITVLTLAEGLSEAREAQRRAEAEVQKYKGNDDHCTDNGDGLSTDNRGDNGDDIESHDGNATPGFPYLISGFPYHSSSLKTL